MKNKVVKIVSCIIFLTLIVKVTISVSYLFRNIGDNRSRMIGLYEEDSLDMIYIGGSSTFTYWQPLRAWDNCGFTSYSYATNSLEADARIYYMKEALKYHRPKLFVVDMNAFIGLGTEILESGMRHGTDSMDFLSVNRWKYIYSYLDKREKTEETDILSYYFDIIKYHTNIGNLSSPEAWGYLDNRVERSDKGWVWIDDWEELSEPTGFKTNAREKIDIRTMDVLIELLEFCKSENIEALFVVSPRIVWQDTEARFNKIGDIVNSYGYNFLNSNDYYEQMGIDFSKDFYNYAHVNLFGAEKYTLFLEDYLKENYELPDHRGEEGYSSWEEEYIKFEQEEKEHKAIVTDIIVKAEKGKKIAKQIQNTSEFSEWASLVNDSQFLVLISVKGVIPDTDNAHEERILERWGITGNEKDGIRVISETTLVYTNSQDDVSIYSGVVGIEPKTIAYEVSSDGLNSSISVNDEEYSIDKEGINAVVVDKNYRKVIDSVVITDYNGKIKINRK